MASLSKVDRSVYNRRMKKNPSQPASARERILLTAHDLFYRHGIRATGIDRVIAESVVTKTTFYRHFPSKHALILAFLDYRHQRWMEWFDAALQRNGDNLDALPTSLQEWLTGEDYRGCAFLNSVTELAEELPQVLEITRQHKQQMVERIGRLLPASRRRMRDAHSLALVVDGAIVHAQFEANVVAVIRDVKRMVRLLTA